jgi:hypothetical protein
VTKPPAPQRLNVRHLTRHAHRAIAERLLYPAPWALLAVEREQDAVILRLNSGGNILAVESWLRQRGYRAEYAGSNPGGYGGALKVTLRATEPVQVHPVPEEQQ